MKFEYVPRFYDADKEEFENRVAEAEEKYHGIKAEHKRTVRFNFRENMETSTEVRTSRFATNYGRVSPWRFVLIILVLLGLLYFIFGL